MKVFTYQCGRKFSDSDIPCFQLISEIRRITSHFIFEAAVKVSRVCNLGPFSFKTNRA